MYGRRNFIFPDRGGAQYSVYTLHDVDDLSARDASCQQIGPYIAQCVPIIGCGALQMPMWVRQRSARGDMVAQARAQNTEHSKSISEHDGDDIVEGSVLFCAQYRKRVCSGNKANLVQNRLRSPYCSLSLCRGIHISQKRGVNGP